MGEREITPTGDRRVDGDREDELQGGKNEASPPLGPDLDPKLQTGERIAIKSSRTRVRGTRKHVKVRIIGDRAWGWIEAAISWGAEVEAVVHYQQSNHRLRKLFDIPESRDFATASQSTPPHRVSGTASFSLPFGPSRNRRRYATSWIDGDP